MADDEQAPDLERGVALADVPAGGVLACRVGDEAVMLARLDDGADGRPRVSALDATCTHLGAALPAGLRTGDLLRCPFHHACFDLATGEALLAPAYRPLRRWPVEVVDGVVRRRAGAEPEASAAERVEDTRGVRRVVVVGGGAAGFAAVERLRRVGYDGALALVTAEPAPPVDRTKLSKAYLAGQVGSEALPLLPGEWYAEHDVDVRLATTATALDVASRTVVLDDGERLGYDALLLATGAEPVRPDLPGFDRDDVLVLRSTQDADAVLAAAERAGGAGRGVVVVGSGFIGLEVAASLREHGVEVTVVAPAEVPLAAQLGADLGALVRSVHEEAGVRFVQGRAAAWTGTALELEDGTSLPGGALVLGLGVRPRTDLAEAAGLEVDDGVLVDAFGETSTPGVFAAGDVARFPDPATGHPVRVEHWAQAQRAGALAAVNLLGARQPLTEPPYFWSKHWALNIRVAGHAGSTDEAEVDGSLADRSAVVRFTADGRVTAVAGVGRDRRVLELEDELLRGPAR